LMIESEGFAELESDLLDEFSLDGFDEFWFSIF